MSKDFQDSAGTQVPSQNQITFGQNNAPDHHASAPPHSFSISFSRHPSRKLTHQDILVVQNLIERCLQLYMNKKDLVDTLLCRARIEPTLTAMIFQTLEEQNAEFFKAYYPRMKLIEQIRLFNVLLEQQAQLIKQSAPQQQQQLPVPPMQSRTHHAAMDRTTTVVDGVPVFPTHPCKIVNPSCAPSSMAAGAQVSFTPPEISGWSEDKSAFDATVESHEANPAGLQLGPIAETGHLYELIHQWENWLDQEAMGNYSDSSMWVSEESVLLDSAEQQGIENVQKRAKRD